MFHHMEPKKKKTRNEKTIKHDDTEKKSPLEGTAWNIKKLNKTPHFLIIAVLNKETLWTFEMRPETSTVSFVKYFFAICNEKVTYDVFGNVLRHFKRGK